MTTINGISIKHYTFNTITPNSIITYNDINVKKIIDEYKIDGNTTLSNVNGMRHNITFTNNMMKPNKLVAYLKSDQTIVDSWYNMILTKGSADYPYTLKDFMEFMDEFPIEKRKELKRLIKQKKPNYELFQIVDNINEIFNPQGELRQKLVNLYRIVQWAPNYNNSIFYYYTNTNNEIISVVSVNRSNNEMGQDITDPRYMKSGLYKKLCIERVKRVTNNFTRNDIIYKLYTQHDYLMNTHLESGLHMISINKQRIPGDPDPKLYWMFTTFMTDQNIQNRLQEDNIRNTIVPIRECIATSISNEYLISSMHCSQSAIGHTHDIMMGVRDEYFIQKNCNDKDNRNNLDIVVYRKIAASPNILTPLLWEKQDHVNNVLTSNRLIRFIVYNRYAHGNNFVVVNTANLLEDEIVVQNECNLITLNDNVQLQQGNSGGPLIIYIGNKFYIIGTLCDGAGMMKRYSLFSSIYNMTTVNMYSRFIYGNDGYVFNTPVNEVIKQDIYSHFKRFTVNDNKIVIS